MQLWVNLEKLQLSDGGQVLEAELKRGAIPSEQQQQQQQVPAEGDGPGTVLTLFPPLFCKRICSS